MEPEEKEVTKKQEEVISEAIASAEPGRCSHFLLKKRRLCRLNRLSGQPYCAEHIPTIETASDSALSRKEKVLVRQPCPLDPKHTVAIGLLEEHLKKCNSRPPDKAYYQPAANTLDKLDHEKDLNILTMSQKEKVDLIMKLIKFHYAKIPPVPDQFGIHEILMTDFVRSDIGESVVRHSTQIGSIVKLLDDYNLLKDSTCFIEFGSGRGGLSFGLARVVKDRGLKNCKIILIDRTSPRYKKDNRAQNSEYADVEVERIKISIEHLLVGKLPGIQKYEHIVGITKHLCGSGTDVALRSLLDVKSNIDRGKVRGLVFATCCHHRTEYENLVGNELLTEDFSNGNFRALRQIAAWATNGDYTSTYLKEIADVSIEAFRFFGDMEKERYPEIKLKKTMGRLVKEIMDYCRAEHIRVTCADIGLTSRLVNYVDLETTRENVAIIAHPLQS